MGRRKKTSDKSTGQPNLLELFRKMENSNSEASPAQTEATQGRDSFRLECYLEDNPEVWQEDFDELEKDYELYLESWKAKCAQTASHGQCSLKEEVDLDRHGMKYIESFRHYAQEASARKFPIPVQFLEALVLLMRNDVLHKHSVVSRVAYETLMLYAKQFPYSYVNGSCIMVSRDSTWLPFFRNKQSFGSQYLMIDDMSLAGKMFLYDTTDTKRDLAWKNPQRWAHVDELLLHCIEKAKESTMFDFNGDLLLFHYLISVALNDTAARMQVFKLATENEAVGTRNNLKLKALIENSLIWRMLVGPKWDPKIIEKISTELVSLISNNDESDAVDMELVEDSGSEDDTPAGACTFSKAELSSIASQFLNAILDIFGSMESIGGFLSTSSYRSANSNYRICMDNYLIKSFWLESLQGKNNCAIESFLMSLKPRDTLRLLGFLVSEKFTATFEDLTAVKKFGTEWPGKVMAVFQARDALNTKSKDIDSFYEVPVQPVLYALIMSMSKTAKIYGSADLVAMVLCFISISIAQLGYRGEPMPLESDNVIDVADLLSDSMRKLKDSSDSSTANLKLGVLGYGYLLQTQQMIVCMKKLGNKINRH